MNPFTHGQDSASENPGEPDGHPQPSGPAGDDSGAPGGVPEGDWLSLDAPVPGDYQRTQLLACIHVYELLYDGIVLESLYSPMVQPVRLYSGETAIMCAECTAYQARVGGASYFEVSRAFFGWN